jgi:hypothetical protein
MAYLAPDDHPVWKTQLAQGRVDLACELNHGLHQGAWRPACRARYVEAFDELARAYFAHVAWEAPDALEARTARLLPGMLLARIDGKSPVEYLTGRRDQDHVRGFARAAARAGRAARRSPRAGSAGGRRADGHDDHHVHAPRVGLAQAADGQADVGPASGHHCDRAPPARRAARARRSICATRPALAGRT